MIETGKMSIFSHDGYKPNFLPENLTKVFPGAFLWSAVNNQRCDNARHPTHQGEQRGDHNRTATLVEHSQGWKNDAYQYS
jgi:hypothetical protein